MSQTTINESRTLIVPTDALRDVVDKVLPIINLQDMYQQFRCTGTGVYNTRQDNVPLKARVDLRSGTVDDGEAELEFRVMGLFRLRKRSRQVLAQVDECLMKYFPEYLPEQISTTQQLA
jgi:hypothetical protein